MNKTIADDGERRRHEAAFIDAFVRTDKQDRWQFLLDRPKRRQKGLARLSFCSDIDLSKAIALEGTSSTTRGVIDAIERATATRSCYAISQWAGIDGCIVPLLETLEHVVGIGLGTVLSIVPGELAYLECEAPNMRYLLSQRTGRS